uniref:Uncharacterized protein n=1 Tax=Anguilla anguilla TaxID=7936 RepID=A0A0E9W548_ANGAN
MCTNFPFTLSIHTNTFLTPFAPSYQGCSFFKF